jgi:hypothetical protein
MGKLYDLEKEDNDFTESVLIPEKRKTKIKRLEKLRKFVLYAYIAMLVLFVMSVLSDIIADTGTTADKFTVVLLAMFMYYLIDIRLKFLKTFERMESLSKADSE